MKRLICLSILAAFAASGLTTYAFDWQSLDVSVESQKTIGASTALTLKDKQGKVFKVVYEDEETTAKFSKKIIKYKNAIFSWRTISLKEISFIIFDGFMNILIIPEEVRYKDADVAAAIPAGIAMTYDLEKDFLRYDIRVMKDNMIARVTGGYMGEEELASKLFAAYDNPAAFMQEATIEALLRENEYLKNEIDKMRRALIYLYNEDWQGRQNPVPPDLIRKVSELRRSNPNMSRKQLWSAARRGKIKITPREFNLIMVIYFNEFE
ncbi:MAG: hypothetical protein ACM3WV_07785 [Bacillota bacterium]